MISVAHVAFLTGYGLLFITVVTSAYALWRRRDLHRIDILVVVASLTISAFLGRTTSFFLVARALLLLSQPFFLLRLVRHFRDLPRMLLAVSGRAHPDRGALVMIVWRPVRPNALPAPASSTAPAWTFSRRLRLHRKLAARRASPHDGSWRPRTGTWVLAALNAQGSLSFIDPAIVRLWLHEF